MNGPERIVLVGPGRAGVSVCRALAEAGAEVAAIVGGGPASAAKAREELGPAPRLSLETALLPGVVVVVAVPDDRLPAVAALLDGPSSAKTLVLHLAGAAGREALAPLAARGIRTAAWHPLRAFAACDAGRGGFAGAAVAVEAEDADRPRLLALAELAGGRPFALLGARRDLYHAAAAIAGNAPLALLDIAERAFVDAGAPPGLARSALLALCRGALDNVERLGPSAALTGPVVRGDAATIAKHLTALGDRSPAERDLYAALCAALVRLAARRPDGRKAEDVRPVLGLPP